MTRARTLPLLLIPLLFAWIHAPAKAADNVDCKSAKRPSGDLKQYFETCNAQAAKGRAESGFVATAAGSVYDNRTTVANLNFADVPTWSDADILAQFPLTRDKRYMTVSSNPSFQRRISWMYPDDGCFARAEQFNVQVAQAGKTKAYKLFAMGDLRVYTDNSPDGVVYWGWHVVPVVKNSAGEPIVFDAALSPCKPLPWKTWLLMMASSLSHYDDLAAGHGVGLGDPNAYYPISLAQGEPSHAQESLTHQTQTYLPAEWDRQLALGRNPNVVLGSTPPWSGFSCVKVDKYETFANVSANSSSTITATCPFATKVVGGGAAVDSGSQLIAKSAKSGNGWQMVARNNASSTAGAWVTAACLTGAPTSSTVTTVTGTTINIAPNSFNTSSATCPSGTLIGGGYNTTTAPAIMRVYANRRSPTNANTWQVSAQNTTSSTKSITAYAYCLGGTSFTYSQTSGSAIATCSGSSKMMGGGHNFPRTSALNIRHMGFFDIYYWIDYLPTAPTNTDSAYAECLTHP